MFEMSHNTPKGVVLCDIPKMAPKETESFFKLFPQKNIQQPFLFVFFDLLCEVILLRSVVCE